MATPEVRKLRHQIAGMVREYEGHLLRLEGHLLVLRAKAARAGADAGARFAGLLAEAERETAAAKDLGRSALAGLERAAEAVKRSLADLQNRFEEANAGTPTVVAKGKAVVRRATIEAKALRHGVRVGLRVARRASRRTKSAKGQAVVKE
jgi:hypothetical protein